jgi:hypothetical protein
VSRFQSLKHSLIDARFNLRVRFGKKLATVRNWVKRPDGEALLTDEQTLKLLLNTKIEFGCDLNKAKETYEGHRRGSDQAPAFDDLVKLGWIQITWGRFFVNVDSARLLKDQSKEFQASLGSILEKRFEKQFSFGADAANDPDLRKVVETFQKTYGGGEKFKCSSPGWVMARIWERLPSALKSTERLRVWIDLSNLIQMQGYGFSPESAWGAEGSKTFREVVFEVLDKDASFLNWGQKRESLSARLALLSGSTLEDARTRLPVVPLTTVDRYLWLENRLIQHMIDPFLFDDSYTLVSYLCRDVQKEKRSEAPHPVMKKILDIASDRPELFWFVFQAVNQESASLADVLLDPRFAALACLLIARWRSEGGAWDRDLFDQDDQTDRLSAFADGVSVLSHFLESKLISPQEVLSLLSWMHTNATEEMFSVIRSELIQQPQDILRSMADACFASLPAAGLGKAEFATALEVITVGSLVDATPVAPVIEAYVQSIRGGDYSLSPYRLNGPCLSSLIQIALRGSPAQKQTFLFPIDIPTLLSKMDEQGANSFEIKDRICRSLRAHIRVLCRAISVWEANPPSEVVGALVEAVRSGSSDNPENNKVAALSVKYEAKPFGSNNEKPIAEDLAAAINNLFGENRENLIRAILETDEPHTLAILLAKVQPDLRGRIETRINDLTPNFSGKVISLTEIQTRIEELLSAGLLDAAGKFIVMEKDLPTLGRVPGRELKHFRYEMQLMFLRKDFEGISKMTPPSNLDKSLMAEAMDILELYQAVSEISKQDGDLKIAEEKLNRLHRKRSDIAVYVVNLFAIQVSKVLTGNLFGRLRGAEAVGARKAFADLEKNMSRVGKISNLDSATIACNKALLFLAIEQPENAFNELANLQGLELQDRVSALTALSFARMGRNTEALSAIELAEKNFGPTGILEAVRAQIQRGIPLDERAGTVSTDDVINRVNNALLDLSRMDASTQAAVFNGPNSLDVLVTDIVRDATGSVIALVPTMKSISVDSKEDDINTLLRELLRQRVNHLGWNVGDQSIGGYSSKGNPGERDVVISKGSAELAVLEAVICDKPPEWETTKKNIISHFQKLLGYSMCPLFFHLTYFYEDNPGEALELLKKAAKTEAPKEFTFKDFKEIKLTDSRPTGFVSKFDSSLGEREVVFLLLDMKQNAQREAAKAAEATKQSKK